MRYLHAPRSILRDFAPSAHHFNHAKVCKTCKFRSGFSAPRGQPTRWPPRALRAASACPARVRGANPACRAPERRALLLNSSCDARAATLRSVACAGKRLHDERQRGRARQRGAARLQGQLQQRQRRRPRRRAAHRRPQRALPGHTQGRVAYELNSAHQDSHGRA